MTVVGDPRAPKLVASCLPSCIPTSRARGQSPIPTLSARGKPLPLSMVLMPTKLTLSPSWAERAANPGNSCWQMWHQEAKNAATVGRPSKSSRATRPSPCSDGRSQLSVAVTPSAGAGAGQTRMRPTNNATASKPPTRRFRLRRRMAARRRSSARALFDPAIETTQWTAHLPYSRNVGVLTVLVGPAWRAWSHPPLRFGA